MRKTRRIVSKYHESKTIRLLSQQLKCRLIVSISYDSEIVMSQNVMRDKWYLNQRTSRDDTVFVCAFVWNSGVCYPRFIQFALSCYAVHINALSI